MSRFDFSLAAPADDDAPRERLAADWIEGSAAISLRREPSYFAASRLQGTAVQVIIGRERSSGRIALVASRAIGLAFAGGMPRLAAALLDQSAPGPMLRLCEVDFDRRAEAPGPGDTPPHVELALT